MKKWEYYDEASRRCAEIAANLNEGKLKTFYFNAAIGFAIKRDRLTLGEAAE